MKSSRLTLAVILLSATIAACFASPAAASVLQHRGTGFKASAPSDFKVSFKAKTGVYKLSSGKGRGTVTYRRLRTSGSSAKIRKLLSGRNSAVSPERGRRASASGTSSMRIRRLKGGLVLVTQVTGSAGRRAMLNRIARSARGGQTYRLTVTGRSAVVALSWKEPTHGQSISGSKFHMQILASDPSQVKEVAFWVDGKQHVLTELYSPYEAYLDTTKMTNNAQHILTGRVIYKAGNRVDVHRGIWVRNGTTSPPPAPAATGKFPALPAGSSLRRRDDFENGTMGQSYTSNQCEANNNRTIADASGGGFGKVWEGWWDIGDAPVAAHTSRCEQGQWGSDGAGEYVYRYVFSVPSDSYLPGIGWHYRLQFHGSNPSTSPPIAAWTKQGSTPDKFALSFQAGDSSTYHADAVQVPRNQWTYVQFRVRWNGAQSWAEFHVNGQPITVKGGGLRKAFSMAVSQGMPESVYVKYGLDGGVTGGRLHGSVALMESYKVG